MAVKTSDARQVAQDTTTPTQTEDAIKSAASDLREAFPNAGVVVNDSETRITIERGGNGGILYEQTVRALANDHGLHADFDGKTARLTP